jgi:hypothetical protein
MDKALVIKTGEILDVKGYYKIMQISIELPEDLSESLKGKLDNWKDYLAVNTGKMDDCEYYTLSDGNKYNKDEVIAGSDNIRDYKLNELSQ